MWNQYVTNFDAPDAHFDYSSLFSDAQVKKVGNPEKMWKLKELVLKIRLLDRLRKGYKLKTVHSVRERTDRGP
jgi:hypothetical protein